MLSLILLTLIGQSAPLDAGSFQRLLDATRSEIRDISFIYEGEIRSIDGNLARGGTFQGTYAFRAADGATVLDAIRYKFENDGSYSNDVQMLFKDEFRGITRLPDLNESRAEVGPGGPGVLNRPGSPERFFLAWFFRDLDAARSNYEFEGWETIDGHSCLKASLDLAPGLEGEGRPHFLLWIDLKRGGHPLKVEQRANGVLRYVVDEIRLAEVEARDGKSVWIPASGEVTTYANGRPLDRETYAVVDGSVVINQGLADSVFSIDAITSRAGTGEMKALRKRAAEKVRRRTDPESVRRDLDERLRKAELQSAELDASAAAREGWDGTPFLQAILVVVGLGAIGAAIYWRRLS